MPDIFTYTEYRKYLADTWTERKAQDPKFSHRFIALRAGFSSSAFFSRILTGDVNLTPSGALRLAEVFRLNHQETRYFELLVLFDQSRSHEERMHFLDRLATWRRHPLPEVDASKLAFCRDWKSVAVLETLDLVEHGDDHESLGKMMFPPIPGAEIEESLRLLDELGLARRDEAGIWRKTDKFLTTGDSDAEAIDIFRQKTMELGIEAMHRFSREDRSISTLTLTLSKEAFERVRDRLRHLRREIMEISRSDDKADRVVQINFQAFPLSMRQAEDAA